MSRNAETGEVEVFRNWYECSECGHEWEDVWSCACDDSCPECGTAIQPSSSEVTSVKPEDAPFPVPEDLEVI